MLYYGAKPIQVREMNLDDIYLLRLKLLLRMAKDYQRGCTFSPIHRQVMWENACHVETESIALGRLHQCHEIDLIGQSSIFIDDYFYRCAKALAVLIKLIAHANPLADRQKSELQGRYEALASILRTSYFAQLFPWFANSVQIQKVQKQERPAPAVIVKQNGQFDPKEAGLPS